MPNSNTFLTAFDCNKKFLGVDYVICASPQLLADEARLEVAYGAARSTSANSERLKADQRLWSKTYGPACGLPEKGAPTAAQMLQSRGCVSQAINDRIVYLQPKQMITAQDRLNGLLSGAKPTATNSPSLTQSDPEGVNSQRDQEPQKLDYEERRIQAEARAKEEAEAWETKRHLQEARDHGFSDYEFYHEYLEREKRLAAEARAKEEAEAKESKRRLQEARDHGFPTYEAYQEYLDRNKRLNESGISLK